jgi:hypothetical protein
MKKIIPVILLAVAVVAIAGFTITSSTEYEAPFPEGYRKWTHIKTGLVGPQSPAFTTTGGYHHIYGNDKAMEGYASGNFPDGSIIVFDVLETIEKGGNTLEGKRRHIDVMYKDAVKFAATGGWWFEEFKDKSQRLLNTDRRKICSDCHAKQTNGVFSIFRD